jgi:hypothetical protein
MESRGRYIAWADLLPRLEAGVGTLIIDYGDNWPIRLWWTPDDVMAMAPCKPSGEDRLLYMLLGEEERDPFVQWCCSRYTDLESGCAYLTVLPAFALSGAVVSYSEFFEGRFPRLEVVATVSCAVD